MMFDSPKETDKTEQIMGRRAWEERTTDGIVDEFMRRENAGRDLLGQALRSSWDWAVRGWIFAVSPYSYPIKVNYAKWGKVESDQCTFGQSAESFTHLQHKCRISVWNKQLNTFLQSLEAARPQSTLLNSLTLQDLKAWKQILGHTHDSPLQAGRKRTLEEVRHYFERKDLGKRPDGMVFDLQDRTIYVIEVARTGDSTGSLRNRYIKKPLKYAHTFNPCKVEQITQHRNATADDDIHRRRYTCR